MFKQCHLAISLMMISSTRALAGCASSVRRIGRLRVPAVAELDHPWPWRPVPPLPVTGSLGRGIRPHWAIGSGLGSRARQVTLLLPAALQDHERHKRAFGILLKYLETTTAYPYRYRSRDTLATPENLAKIYARTFQASRDRRYFEPCQASIAPRTRQGWHSALDAGISAGPLLLYKTAPAA